MGFMVNLVRETSARGTLVTALRESFSTNTYIAEPFEPFVSGTKDRGEVVRLESARLRAHVTWILQTVAGGDPIAYRHRAYADECGAPRTSNEEVRHRGARLRPLVTWILRAIVGGYPIASRHRARMSRNMRMNTRHHGRK